jgi:hypothetical protein
MLEPFETIDRELEWFLHNLRGGIEDFFCVKEKTAKILMGGGLVSLDALNWFLQEKNLETIHHSILANIMIMYFCERLPWPKAKKNNSGIKIIDWEIEFWKRYRISVFLFWIMYSYLMWDNQNAIPIYMYIISKLHDNDDRGIKNWIKWMLSELKKSIQPA